MKSRHRESETQRKRDAGEARRGESQTKEKQDAGEKNIGRITHLIFLPGTVDLWFFKKTKK